MTTGDVFLIAQTTARCAEAATSQSSTLFSTVVSRSYNAPKSDSDLSFLRVTCEYLPKNSARRNGSVEPSAIHWFEAKSSKVLHIPSAAKSVSSLRVLFVARSKIFLNAVRVFPSSDGHGR